MTRPGINEGRSFIQIDRGDGSERYWPIADRQHRQRGAAKRTYMNRGDWNLT
jgi:hypothetical protein